MAGFMYNDGGRAEAGFKGAAGDCVTRAIAIATGKSYREVYDNLNALAQSERITKRRAKKSSARTGVHKDTFKKYLASLGWKWIPTMLIGQGCNVHLIADELPVGTIIVSVSRHLTTMIDGVVLDTSDPRTWEVGYKDGVKYIRATRCVYGYFTKE